MNYEKKSAEAQIMNKSKRNVRKILNQCLKFKNGHIRRIVDITMYYVIRLKSILKLNALGVTFVIHDY